MTFNDDKKSESKLATEFMFRTQYHKNQRNKKLRNWLLYGKLRPVLAYSNSVIKYVLVYISISFLNEDMDDMIFGVNS